MSTGMKKVIVIIAPTPAPYRAYEYDLVQQALQDEYEFHVLFRERKGGDMQWQDDVPKLMKWEVLPKSSLNRFLSKIPGFHRVNRDTIKHLKVLQPDAVILHGYDTPALWQAFFWARKRGCPLIFRSDSNIAREQRRSGRLWPAIKSLILRRFFGRIDAFLTVGTANEAYYEFYGGNKERFFRSSYMVDVDMFASAAASQRRSGKQLKKKLGIKDEKIILFTGRFVPKKDVITLVRAFAKILAVLGNTALLLVGDGPLKKDIEKEINHIRDHVCFAGFCQPDEVAIVMFIDLSPGPAEWD